MTSAPTERTSERGTIVALDQLTSSATNFVVVLVASRLFGASDFGAFALSLSAFSIALGVVRTTSSERLLLARPTGSGRAAFVPLSFLIALSALELGLLAIWLVTSSAGAAVWLIAAPVILLQDRMRYLALRVRPLCALASDGVWLVAAIAGWMVVRVDVLEALAAIRVVLVVGPVVGLAVLVLGLRGDVELVVEHDAAETLTESRFVLDSWILSSAVFVALSGVAALASLAVAGQVRLLFLIFQPFFSLAYVGRWGVLRARTETRLERWPIMIMIGSAVYGAAAIGALELFERLDLLPAVWRIGLGALVLNAIGQVARAYHQGVVDLLRRTLGPGLVGSRSVFAVVLMVTAPAFAGLWGTVGAALALSLSFGAGAVAIASSVDRTRSGVR